MLVQADLKAFPIFNIVIVSRDKHADEKLFLLMINNRKIKQLNQLTYISRTELIECSVSLEPQFCYRDLRGVRESTIGGRIYRGVE